MLGAIARRHPASEGEREMLHAVRGRLPEGVQGRIEGFVAFASPALVILMHSAALIGAGLLGIVNPWLGSLLSLAVTAHLVAEATGRRSLLRWVLPKSASYNLVAEVRAERPLGSIVVAAPLDAPGWRPGPQYVKRPLQAVVLAAVVMSFVLSLRALAQPWGRPTQGMYLAALGVLVATVFLAWAAQRRTAAVEEDASAPAALIELLRRVRREPPPGLTVVAVFTGCAHAYQNGMAAFLAVHGRSLPQPMLVLALDQPGRAPVGAVVSEGPLYPQHHRPTGPALVERLRWAGAEIPVIDHALVTDARVAMLWGYRGLALVGSGAGESTPEGTRRAVDLVEALLRLYAEDLARVPRAARLLDVGRSA